MTKNTPSGAKKHHESTEPESYQTAKMFFFFFFFRRASSNLRDSFTMVFAQNSSIFHWVVHQGGVVYWTVLCYHPYLVSMLFADLLSLHHVTFLMFFILVHMNGVGTLIFTDIAIPALTGPFFEVLSQFYTVPFVCISRIIPGSCNGMLNPYHIFSTDGSVIAMMICTSIFQTWSKSCTRTTPARRGTLGTGSAIFGGKEEWGYDNKPQAACSLRTCVVLPV